MTLPQLAKEIQSVLDETRPIEANAIEALSSADFTAAVIDARPLPMPFSQTMRAGDALPLCQTLLETPLPWAPPEASEDPNYTSLSKQKTHVELIGPSGLVASQTLRLGVYGIAPNTDYGLRSHKAEETFVILAGEAEWKRGEAPYQTTGPGERSHHPSMLPHATRTGARGFMSVYIWCGDVQFGSYSMSVART